MYRVGYGFDVHRLTEKRKLILCGVEIPHTLGLLGHSDADVAIHALMDAVIGALALGDIGQFFPDTDNAYKDIDSRILLRRVLAHPKVKEYRIVNLDLTIMAEKPKVLPYRLQMRQNLAADLDLELDAVSVKATTTEKLGFTGREEGIAASCAVLLSKREA